MKMGGVSTPGEEKSPQGAVSDAETDARHPGGMYRSVQRSRCQAGLLLYQVSVFGWALLHS